MEDGEITDEFSELCALDGSMHPKAEAINHISNSMLNGKRPLHRVFADFAEFVDSLPLVGFNNHAFDDLFLKREANRANTRSLLDNGSHDVMLMHGRQTLKACCEEYGIANNQAHRALSDALATCELYEVIRREWALNSTDVRDITADVVGDELSGETLCFTGSTDYYPKRACQTLALAHGAVLSNGVTKKVTMLVNLAGKTSGKTAKADQYGIRIVGGQEFLERIGYPTDRPVRYDTLQTGTWFSNLSDEVMLMVRRELGLPVKKPLVYYRKNGTRAVAEKNEFGVDILVNRDQLDAVPVLDVRVIETCQECEMVTLEVAIEGEEAPFHILAPHLVDMQKGKDHYLSVTSGDLEEA